MCYGGEGGVLSQLIWRYIWQAHVHGILPLPTLVTRMAELAGAHWRADEVSPLPPLPHFPDPSSFENEHEEEPAQPEVPPQTQATPEAQQTSEEPQPQPQQPDATVDPYPEPEQ
ncbi:hypothetical protein Ahy_A10g049120 isoform A [Arachis hypogaea]|uniref:Uncharacterized protein n=1 Tax=Arachis hypogaea TaxID=3818 RepID=A0A445B6M8_ARAHY|nr:hypothetical protein Ahy_A10g049120 isoform A [Arachis hypogaea]